MYFAVWRHTKDYAQLDPPQDVSFEIWGGRVRASDGQLVGGSFQISIKPAGTSHIGASLAYSASAQEHLVVWAQREPASDTLSVWGQRVRDGTLVGTPCEIFPSTSPAPTLDMSVMPVVVYNPAHNEYAVVTWHANKVKIRRVGLVEPDVTCYPNSAEGGLPTNHSRAYPDVVYLNDLDQYLVTYEMPELGSSQPAVGVGAGHVGSEPTAAVCASSVIPVGIHGRSLSPHRLPTPGIQSWPGTGACRLAGLALLHD